MEDALISPVGFMILSGAGLIEASNDAPIIVHSTERTTNVTVDEEGIKVVVSEQPYLGKKNDGTFVEVNDYPASAEDDFIYVMFVDDNGEICTEPFIPSAIAANGDNTYTLTITTLDGLNGRKKEGVITKPGYEVDTANIIVADGNKSKLVYKTVFVDYYVAHKSGAQQIDITPDKFGGNYYLEASTLFRTQDGVDMPAEFIIPNCKIQSNFTFTMASSGDPSSFTFTMDAFPDYTRFDKTKKVLAAIQIIDEGTGSNALRRASTPANKLHEENEATGAIIEKKS